MNQYKTMTDEYLKKTYVPDVYQKSIFDINYERLKIYGIKLISFDIDDTIVPIEKHEPTLVEKSAKLFGCKDTELKSAVSFLEKKFPIPSDGNTPDFGGGLQHHLRDFAHHPTIIGLIFSMLTQFTEKSYGTDVNGKFIIVPVPEKSRIFIGKDIPDKIIKGTLVWFFHLVSDIAGSSSTAGISGGTGIPGPLLSLAKEISVLPLFQNIKIGDNSLTVFLSKLFNGTLLAKHDKNGKIIKGTELQFDLMQIRRILIFYCLPVQ